MNITIAVQVHNFQHRFSWMLSSVLHQLEGPQIQFDVSHAKDNGQPTTEAICDLYREQGLEINCYEYPLELLQYRGLTRNGALLRCQTEWLLFADCDMVYHPHFFKWLANEMANMDDDKLDHIFITGRDSNTISKANAVVGAEDYSAVIPNPWKRADRRLDKIPRACVGAGYFQLINVDRCEHDNYYVDPERNKDKSWIDAYAKASSDYQFRRRVGKTHRLPRWFWRSQIHLNHNRDNMFKKHLVEQR